MSKLSLFVDQHTPLRSYQPTASRVGLGTANSTLWAVGKRLSVWTLPTALYQGATLALLQEGIDSAVIAAFEACSPKNFGHKEDPLLSQVIRIAIITALSSGVIVLVSRAVAQTPLLNRTAFLLPPFSQSFGGMVLVVASSHLFQAAGQYLVQQPVKKSEEEPKITTTARPNIEADGEKKPTVKETTTAELLPHSHRGHIQAFLRLKKWDKLSELYNKQRENEANYELDPEFWDIVKHIVKLHDLLKLESFKCDSLSEYSLAYEALELFGSLVESAAMRNRRVCRPLQPSIDFFIAKNKPQVAKIGNEYLNLACQKIIQAIESHKEIIDVLKKTPRHTICKISSDDQEEILKIKNKDQPPAIHTVKRIRNIEDLSTRTCSKKMGKVPFAIDHYTEELGLSFRDLDFKLFDLTSEYFSAPVAIPARNSDIGSSETVPESISASQELSDGSKDVDEASETKSRSKSTKESDLKDSVSEDSDPSGTTSVLDRKKYTDIKNLLTQYHNGEKKDREEILSNLKKVCASS